MASRASRRTIRTAWRSLSMSAILFLWTIASTNAATLYVSKDAIPGGDGSRERPLRSIQEAIRRSRDGDVVLVGPGTYRERVRFFGRRIEVRATDGPAHTVIDADRNGSAVRFIDGETFESHLVGFRITRGRGEPTAIGSAGGGILVVDASPTLRGLSIEQNGADAGAGVAAFGGAPRLVDCELAFNEARLTGGGWFFENSTATVEQCRVASNRAVGARNYPTGGAGASVGGSLELVGGEISGNTALNGDGGGLALSNEADVHARSVRFSNNLASFGTGGAIAVVDASILTLHHSALAENEADSGGGIGCRSAFLALYDNRIESNRAVERVEGERDGGGGIALFANSHAALEHDVIRDNTATFVGGLRPSAGGGFAVHASSVRLDHVDAIGNRADPGCGGAGYAADATIMSSASTYRDHAALLAEGADPSTSARGGAWRLERCDATFEGDRIDANRAGRPSYEAAPPATPGTGGGLSIEASTLRLRSVMVTRNFAGADGGGLEARDSVFEALHVTVAANVASRGLAWSMEKTHVDVDGSIVTRSLRGEALSRHVSTTLLDGDDAGVAHTSVRRSFVDGRFVNGLDALELRSERQGKDILHLDPGFISVSRGDFRLRLGSVCIDLLEEEPEDLPLDVDGEPRPADGDRDGLALVDLGADEVTPSVAVRYGSVLAPSDDLENVLFVNDSAGDSDRSIALERHEPWHVDLDAPTAGPASPAYVIYAWIEAPDPLTLFELPDDLGLLGHPLPGTPATTGDPVAIWNTLGHLPNLGRPTEPSTLAPTMLLDRPRGIGIVTTITLQGLIESVRSPSGVAVTNAVILHTH